MTKLKVSDKTEVLNDARETLPYILIRNKYVPATPVQLLDVEGIYLTAIQVKHINNLLKVQKEISREIEIIIKNQKYNFDETIVESTLSERAKNACYNMINKAKPENKVMLSDIAMFPLNKWSKVRGMGDGTIKEIKSYLINNGFKILK